METVKYLTDIQLELLVISYERLQGKNASLNQKEVYQALLELQARRSGDIQKQS